MSKCKYCSAEITWKDDPNGKHIPYSADGTKHQCKRATSSSTNTNINTEVLNQILIELKAIKVILAGQATLTV